MTEISLPILLYILKMMCLILTVTQPEVCFCGTSELKENVFWSLCVCASYTLSLKKKTVPKKKKLRALINMVETISLCDNVQKLVPADFAEVFCFTYKCLSLNMPLVMLKDCFSKISLKELFVLFHFLLDCLLPIKLLIILQSE